MTDYGKGALLGGATVLPATTALGIALADTMHPLVIAGFLMINMIMFVLLFAHISRYFVNKRT